MHLPVRDYTLSPTTSITDLLAAWRHSGGFTARLVAEAADILRAMVADAECTRFLAFPACIVATGLRGVLRQLVERRVFHCLVTTCGTLDHDIARSFADYFAGSFFADDIQLRKEGVHRLGNIFIPLQNYGPLIEQKMRELLCDTTGVFAPHELWWRIGEQLPPTSILHWTARYRIPVIVPAPYDGAVGYQVWQLQQTQHLQIDLKKDEDLINDLVWEAKHLGALIIGGGVAKHHVIWWSQFRGGLDYAIYITTATEYDGSLSGARTHEAISWGKVRATARHITVPGEATLILPLLAASVL